MITSISLINFKCFKEATFELSAFNIFAGINGAGKSTAIQSLLVLRQSWESRTLADQRLLLNGSLAAIGTAKEVYCAVPTKEHDYVQLEFASDRLGRSIVLSAPQSVYTANDYSFHLQQVDVPELSDFELFQEPFNYLNAERIGPRVTSPIPADNRHPLCVGKFGEHAPFIISSDYRDRKVENRWLLGESDDGKIYPTARYQWQHWMSRLFPGFQGESTIHPQADQVFISLAIQRNQSGQGIFVRPTNTGFGLSVAMGIVVAGLFAKPDTILIVENPEAHLHPRAQSTIGEFLARVAAGGVQVFVETHSEHVLNGARRMVKEQILRPDRVRLHYFSQSQTELSPTITSIPVSPSGEISQWPDGFFDQLDRDLGIILD